MCKLCFQQTIKVDQTIIFTKVLYITLHAFRKLFKEIVDKKWKLAEQARKYSKMRPWEQVEYRKKYPSFEPVNILKEQTITLYY